VPLVGADVFGKPLDAEHVHRPDLVSALSGETAASLLRASAIQAVVLAAVRTERPVLEVCSR